MTFKSWNWTKWNSALNLTFSLHFFRVAFLWHTLYPGTRDFLELSSGRWWCSRSRVTVPAVVGWRWNSEGRLQPTGNHEGQNKQTKKSLLHFWNEYTEVNVSLYCCVSCKAPFHIIFQITYAWWKRSRNHWVNFFGERAGTSCATNLALSFHKCLNFLFFLFCNSGSDSLGSNRMPSAFQFSTTRQWATPTPLMRLHMHTH